MIRRINLYGGPGTGKSTAAAHLFAYLKKKYVNDGGIRKVELVTQYVKQWAYDGRKPKGFFQNYLFGNQQYRQQLPLLSGVDIVVTDSPLLLNVLYANIHGVPSKDHLLGLAQLHQKAYPSLHILLKRQARPYVAHGRYETEEQAKQVDNQVALKFTAWCIPYLQCPSTSYNQLERIVDAHIHN